jgi:hypothetical protein
LTVLAVSTPRHGHVIVDASDGVRYHSDLSGFSGVHCFPRSEAEWRQVSVDSYGLALVWSSRFEVHVDQVVALAYRREAAREIARVQPPGSAR